MATNKINVNTLIGIYNLYLEDKGKKKSSSFQEFCTSKKYVTEVTKDNIFNFKANLSVEGASKLDFDESDIEAKKGKLDEFLKFLVKNRDNIDGDVSGVVRDIMITALDADVTFSLTEKEAETVLGIPCVIPKYRIPKTNKVLQLLKNKAFRGAAVSSLGGVLGAAVASGKEMLAGTSITDNVAASAASVASKGAVVGFAATTATLIAVDIATRYYYSKTYGVKSNNDEVILGSKAKTSEDIKNLGEKLPLNRLISKLRETDDKIIELSSGNFINRTHARILTKINRNRLHALMGYRLSANETMIACEKQSDKEKMHAATTLIGDYMADTNAKYTILAEKTGKHLVADIFSRWQQRLDYIKTHPDASQKELKKKTKKIKKENRETRRFAREDLFKNTMMPMLTGESKDEYPSIFTPEPLVKPERKKPTKIDKSGVIMEGENAIMNIINALGISEAAKIFEVSEDMLTMFVNQVKKYHGSTSRKKNPKPINVARIKDEEFKKAYSAISAKMADREFIKTIDEKIEGINNQTSGL